jgi:hypothetical protein
MGIEMELGSDSDELLNGSISHAIQQIERCGLRGAFRKVECGAWANF